MPRHAYSIVVGLVMQYFLFREGMVHFFLMILVVKILMHSISRENQPWIVFFVVIAHNTIYMVYDLFYR
jgi:hypothetical protein